MENAQANEEHAASLNWLYPVAAVVAIALIAGGVYLEQKTHDWSLLASGAVALVGVLIAWPIAHALGGGGAMKHCVVAGLKPLNDRMEEFSVMLNLISEQQLLSDRAKTVAYREKDREALRRAIADDLSKKDWEGALVLVDEMDNGFGYKSEAERVRETINQQFADHIRRQVQTAVTLIDRHIGNQQWAAAQREADRLLQQFPTLDDARRISKEVEVRRQAYKQHLLDEYQDKISRKEIDGAIAIVRQLDFYLTPDEGTAMAESVRGLFREKLNQLKDSFTDAVHRGHWADAHRLGETIVRDFPNTQMAKEVRDKLESLKERAKTSNGTPVTA